MLNELKQCDYIIHAGDIVDIKILERLQTTAHLLQKPLTAESEEEEYLILEVIHFIWFIN